MPFGTLPLNDGKNIPAIAFGTGSTYKRTDVTRYVQQALEAGFWHIDTAQCIGLARSELYITTKYASGDVQETVRSSLSNLGFEYVDLYLIHNPRNIPDVDAKDGLAKSIGVSNFTLEALQSLVQKALVWPAVNQIEFHPYNYAKNKALLEWSSKHGIVTEAYSSLSSITKFPSGPVDAPVAAAAARLGISPTQVLLSWVRAKGVVIVTTTSHKDRLEEYLAVGDLPQLPDADVAAIDAAGAQGPPGLLDYGVLNVSVRGRRLTVRAVVTALAAFIAFYFVFLRLGSCGM
ncbi:NADP-dependent oxidoreductase domain-containing protein [Mycena capillaripes]|nr:NADP-dependent oxidoreductase domain-containing protein [Mycena capillaripes]